MLPHHLGHHINGHGEDDCAIVLRRNAVQRLQVSQLERRRALYDHLSSVPQRAARLVLALSSDHLGAGLPGSLRLSSHRPLQVLRHPHVLHLHPLDEHAPGIGGLVQAFLQ